MHYLCKAGVYLAWRLFAEWVAFDVAALRTPHNPPPKECYTLQSRIWPAAFLVLCLYQPALTGSALQFVSSNVFPGDMPVSDVTAPRAVWSVSFTVDDHPIPQVATDAGFNVIFSNFDYSLNGDPIPVTPQIRFFTSDFGGMLDVGFSNGAEADIDPVTGLAFIGPMIFTGSTSAPILQAGSYTATGGVFWVASLPAESLSGTVVTAGKLSDPAVPEPDTGIEVLGAGLCFVTAAVARRARKSESLED